ncbi:oxidoreductase [Brevibacillus agri]|uniref:oxidoreductase n=1 Tax=Brevibacillus agri TaxID=51101 RepID=UPI0024C0AD20|nr:oxidoreductase [Brevibacillus agri]WHX33097.1 oxidoreductase [Brevibacillus agri]
MDLVNGKLYWSHTFPNPPRYPAISDDLRCGVVIVGGGSSCANTGLLQFANDKLLAASIHSFGEEQGVRFFMLFW